MKKYFLTAILCIFIFNCTETITTDNFVPADADGLINLHVQEVLNSKFILSLLNDFEEKTSFNPLDLININLETSFGTNIDNLNNASVFFINQDNAEDNISSGIILEFEELDTELILESIKTITGLFEIEYNNNFYYYSEILDSGITVYNNFILYSTSREIMENILDTAEVKKDKNSDIKDVLEPLKLSTVNGVYFITKDNFISLNESIHKFFNQNNQSILGYNNIQSETISFILTVDINETMYLNLIIQFPDINDAENILDYLNTLKLKISETLSLLNSSGQNNVFLELFNSLELYADDSSITISVDISHTSILSLFER